MMPIMSSHPIQPRLKNTSPTPDHVADPYCCAGSYDAQRHQPVHAGHGIGIDRVGASSVERYAEVLLSRHDDADSSLNQGVVTL